MKTASPSASAINLKNLLGKPGVLALDVREADEFAYEHIEGTTNLPQSRLREEMESVSKDKEIYVFCNTGIRSAQSAEILRSNGFPKVHLVEGGLTAWKSAGFPVVQSKGPIPIMRQVQIIAGSLALIGGLFPSLRGIAIFVGAGLIFAGISGFCTMAKLLVYMPWNKSLKTSPASKKSSPCEPGCS